MPDLVLPVLDEAESLPGVLAAVPAGFHPIVVDNGSTDGSGGVAAAAGAEVVVESRPGFGAACFAGLMACKGEVVCFMDCDGSLDPAELPSVVGPVAAGDADLVLGRRVHTRGAWPLHARLGNRALAFELRRRSGVRLRDIGPMRAVRREELIGLGVEDRRFGWPLEMVLRAASAEWRIEEVPVSYGERSGGESKVTGSLRGSARAIRDMRRVLREA